MPTETANQYAMVVGFFLPLFTAMVLQHHWPTWLKTVIGWCVMIGAAIGTAAVQGRLDHTHAFVTVAYVMSVAIGSFQHFWRPLGVADAIEKATTLT